MARPLRIEYPGAFYHVTSRGNEQKEVFKSQRDREKFLSYLESAVVRYGAVVNVWCLMSNHYHLLLETPSGNLAQIMRHINGAYTTYFNIKRKRAGHLFQVRYKAILVEENGVGWFGFDRQRQTLNGRDFKKLEVGLGSLGYARMQVRVSQTTDVTYDVYGDGVARPSPGIPF